MMMMMMMMMMMVSGNGEYDDKDDTNAAIDDKEAEVIMMTNRSFCQLVKIIQNGGNNVASDHWSHLPHLHGQDTRINTQFTHVHKPARSEPCSSVVLKRIDLDSAKSSSTRDE